MRTRPRSLAARTVPLAITLAFALASAVAAAPALAQSSDPVVRFKRDDPAMAEARRAAMATLDKFLGFVAEGAPGAQDVGIKVALPDSDGGKEEIWVSPFTRHSPDVYSGALANNPVALGELRHGDTVRFGHAQITDWYVVITGEGYGHFTMRALLDRLSPAQRAEAEAFFAEDPLPPGWE